MTLRPWHRAVPAAILGLAIGIALAVWAPPARPAADRVLFLDSTLVGGESSPEAERAKALGFEVEIVDASGWAAKSAADFSSYRAIVLGDSSCGGSASPAADNANVWGPQIDGNAMLIGTDEVFHDGQGGRKLTNAAIDYATAQPGKTGALVSLSCYYHDTAPGTDVPLLDGLSTAGDFTVRGVGCYDQAHITATDSALRDITDTDLSGWSCSVHEAFDSYPRDFVVLAIAQDIGETYTAPDGTVGTPYILARGVGTSYFGRNYVALGDSVSAGEGIAWDFRWSASDRRWKQFGPDKPSWATDYTVEDCHQTPEAHPRVAASLIAAKLTHLSCTESSARNGILDRRVADGGAWRAPAQLGSSVAGFAPPNKAYDEAKPDVVSVSLGANDVDFVGLVVGCYGFGGFGGCDTNQHRLDDRLAAQKRDLGLVLDEIKRRRVDGKAPLVVLTKYIDPFPATWSKDCPDLDIPIPGFSLEKDEMDFLRKGLQRLNNNIEDVAKQKGALTVAASGKFADHKFCAAQPWVYGPSINFPGGFTKRDTAAPFHPTPAGQREIAKSLAGVVEAKLPVRAGDGVRVALPAGRLFFDSVSDAGEAVILSDADGASTPLARAFKKVAGYEISTSALWSGNVRVSLPADGPLGLFHFVDGAWKSVPASFDGRYVSGEVDSLSPFAIGDAVSPVTARATPVPGGIAPHPATFDATQSSVEDGSAIADFDWDFGDGTTGTGTQPQHTYAQSGDYTARLVVTAANGAQDETTVAIRVINAAPSAVIEGPVRARPGQVVTFDGSASSDANGAVGDWSWSFGDDSQTASGARVSHAFTSPGSYEVRLLVTDEEGEKSTATATILVSDAVQEPERPTALPDNPPGPSASGLGSGNRPGTDPKGKARIGKAIRMGRRGELLIPVTCARNGGACNGTVRVTRRRGHRRISIGSARIRLSPGRARLVRVHPKHGTLPVTSAKAVALQIAVRLTDGTAATRQVTLKQSRS